MNARLIGVYPRQNVGKNEDKYTSVELLNLPSQPASQQYLFVYQSNNTNSQKAT